MFTGKNDDYFEILQKKSNFEILMVTSFQSNDDYYVKIDENSRKFGKIQIILEPLQDTLTLGSQNFRF